MSAAWAAGEGDPPDVGSVGEEAARLLEAFTEALGRRPAASGDDPGSSRPAPGAGDGPSADPGAAPWDGLVDLAHQAVQALQGVGDQVANDAPECRWCPWCRTIHALRRTSPEARTHLMSTARSMVTAATVLLDLIDRDEAGPTTPDVEHIHLDPEPDQHEEEQR